MSDDICKVEVQAEDGTWVTVATIQKKPRDRWSWGMYCTPIDIVKPRVRVRYEAAPSVKRALVDELGEDGQSMLTHTLDEAAERAIEDGSEFFVDTEDPNAK